MDTPSEYRKSKFPGELYSYIMDDYIRGNSVIHIGDNEHSDYLMARKNGWGALLYEKK